MSPQILVVLGVALASCVLLALAIAATWQAGDQVMAAARARTQSMVYTLNQHTARTMDSVDMLLRAVAKELGPDPQDAVKRSSVTALLAELTRNQSYVRAIQVLERDTGAAIFEFIPGRDIDLGAAAADQAPRSEGGLHIGKPVQDASGTTWLVPVSRRIKARDGIPGNAVVAYVALDAFQRFYEDIDVGQEGAIVLFSADGTILVRRPFDPANIGRDASGAALFRNQLPVAPSGTYEAATASDGIVRVVSYRRVDGWPLVIVAALAKSEVTAAWREDALRDLGIALAAMLAITIFGVGFVRIHNARARTERVLRATLEHMDQGLLMFDADDTVRVCNRRAMELLDLPPSLVQANVRFSDLLAHQRRSGEFEGADPSVQQLVHIGGLSPDLATYERRRPNGTILEIRTVDLPGGGAVRTFTDITARRAAEEAARAGEARYRLLAENASDMIVQAGRDTVRRYVSPSARDLLGYEPEELIGTRPTDGVHPDEAEGLSRVLDDLSTGRTPMAVSRQRFRRKDGSWVWTEATFRLVQNAAGEPDGYVASVRDITERRALEEQLLELARTDALTGLHNRRAFEECLDQEWRRALRHGTPFGLLTLDVDFFKQFNDHFGHAAGDECLRQVASVLRLNRRSSDVVARVGGEEFTLLLPETDAKGARFVAEAIRSALEAAGMAHPKSTYGVVTASIGLAAFDPQHPQDVRDLLRASDEALYAAKRTGRNKVVWTDPDKEPATSAAA
ncbi:MAG TPA: diguanylate cyclase [Microvirga sp.]|jgi:diguanylate cyclase (GGDEF)-like protein/PAS domain S-box-containing protein|nr:diguanylate cyclase [Microvirga sp.]